MYVLTILPTDLLWFIVVLCILYNVSYAEIHCHCDTCTAIVGRTRKSITLQWCHNEHDGVSNHQPHDCLLNRLFRRRSKKTSKLRVTGYCGGNSPVTGEFPAQRASNAENVSTWWRHHEFSNPGCKLFNPVVPHAKSSKPTTLSRGSRY